MAYTALLRYEFVDVEGQQLRSFEWNPLSGTRISEVTSWLQSGAFPASFDTSAIVAGLSRGDYGTDDQNVIERDICPDAGSYVVVEVDWRDADDPGLLVRQLNREIAARSVRQKEKVLLTLKR